MFRRRGKASDETTDAAADLQPTDELSRGAIPKGRPTPKRRQAAPARGPAAPAPKTRKEAVRYQRERLKTERAATTNPSTPKARRAAMLAGDPNALPRRDQGPVKELARNWVDSRRMLSNYLLVLFPLLILGYLMPILALSVYALLVVFLLEWFITGQRIRKLAIARKMTVKEGAFGLGFYAGSRAYLPRRFRMPRPKLQLGDTF